MPQFESILVLKDGAIAHRGGYQELLAEGVLTKEVISEASESPEEAQSSSDTEEAVVVATEVEKDIVLDPTPPSEMVVYAFFVKSVGTKEVSFFFLLAAICVGERCFESKYFINHELYQRVSKANQFISDVWLKYWADSTDPSLLNFYILVFTAIVLSGLLILYAISL